MRRRTGGQRLRCSKGYPVARRCVPASTMLGLRHRLDRIGSCAMSFWTRPVIESLKAGRVARIWRAYMGRYVELANGDFHRRPKPCFHGYNFMIESSFAMLTPAPIRNGLLSARL
jgi:hypothetical protein